MAISSKPSQETQELIELFQDVTTNLLSNYANRQDLEYEMSPNKPEKWLSRFMNAENVHYSNVSYLEGIQSTQNEASDISLKHCLCFLKL